MRVSGFLLLSHSGYSEGLTRCLSKYMEMSESWSSLESSLDRVEECWTTELYPSNKRKLLAPSYFLKIAQTVYFSHFPSHLEFWRLAIEWNDRDCFSIEKTTNSFLWMMWCSEERGSRIIVLSWSLIPSQQDNNNNTMTSLDKQRHSVLYSFWDWTLLITHFSRRLVTFIIYYCPNVGEAECNLGHRAPEQLG